MVWVLVALFALYVVVTTWQMRRAVRTKEPAARQREAVRLLLVAFAGVPLLVLLILVAV